MPCKFILTAGKRKGSQCDKGCSTRKYCGRHVKMMSKKESGQSQIEAADDLQQFIGTQQPVNINEDRIRKSVFALTMNTNKPINKLSPEDREKIKKIMNHLFIDDNIIDFVDCRDGGGCFRENPELLIEKRWDYKFEVGEKFHKLHAHALIEIDHRTILTLDISGLKSLFREFFGWNWHINVSAKKQIDSSTWSHYINKYIPSK